LLLISLKNVIIKIYGRSKKTYVQIKDVASQKSLEKKIISKNSSMFFKFEKNIYYFTKKLNFLFRYWVFLAEGEPRKDARFIRSVSFFKAGAPAPPQGRAVSPIGHWAFGQTGLADWA